MKHALRSFLIVLTTVNFCFAQNKLSNSQQSGYHSYIYKLTDKETFNIAADGDKIIDESFLHTLIDSFYNVKSEIYLKKLPYGNYLQVKAVKNVLEYKLLSENNVNLQFINNRKDFQFIITDLKGNLLPFARVKVGKNKTVKYNEQAKLYIAGSGAKKQVLTVQHEGVSNYFTYMQEEKYKPYRNPQRKTSNNLSKRVPVQQQDGTVDLLKQEYKGYMVFNKPMYKPLDTVKFKAYLVTDKGKSLKNKPLRVDLYKEWGGEGTMLTTLNPYREGGYEYSFVLADSLQLKLGRNYNIVFKEQTRKAWKNVYWGNFRYEDYELKSIKFVARTDKEEHSPGSPVTIFMKATDENDLAVPDGRVKVVVRTNNVLKYYNSIMFIKDSLWTKDVVLDPIGETKLVLPDSIFPSADIDFSVSFAFLNSNNEATSTYRELKYRIKDKEVVSQFKKDSLYFDYRVKDKSVKQKAIVFVGFPHNNSRDSIAVELPGVIKMNYKASFYVVKTADGYQKEILVRGLKPELSVSASQSKDSLQILVNNIHKIPFWYTIFSGDKVLSRGYTTSIDTTIRHTNSKLANIKLNHVWAGTEMTTETSALYAPNMLNVKLLAPDLIYPGQTVNMQVKVTDVNDRPVAATDVTAYAYTSKFKNGYDVSLPDFGQRFLARKFTDRFEANELALSGKMKMTWDKWGKELNLDTIEYYKFSRAKELYTIQETGENNDMAIVAPFVVKDGEIEPVHIIYIDEIPVYFSQANQLKRYAFRIKPGKHSIRMRTSGYSISLDDYNFVKGKKTIISVAADLVNSKAKVSVVPGKLTDQESYLLNQYMIRIENNFKGDKATVNELMDLYSYKNLLTLPYPSVGGYGVVDKDYQSIYANNSKSNLLVGPFSANVLQFQSGKITQNFVHEPGYTYSFLPGLLKQKSYDGPYVFNTSLAGGSAEQDYKQYPIKKEEADSIWNEYLNLRSYTTGLFNLKYRYGNQSGRLIMKLDSGILKQLPYLKNVIIGKYDEPDFVDIYPGNTVYFNALEKGVYHILFLFKDNRYAVAEDVVIKARGINYFDWKNLKVNPADELSKKIDAQIKSVNLTRDRNSAANAQRRILDLINDKYFDQAILTEKMTGRVVSASDKKPIAGVSVKIKGANYKTTTKADGRFEIKVPKNGKLILTFIGYEPQEVSVVNGNIGDVSLRGISATLDEVVVTAYGIQRKKDITGSVSNFGARNELSEVSMVSKSLSGRVAGIAAAPGAGTRVVIRGNNSVSDSQAPLYIIDGVPSAGDANFLDPDKIASIDVLKGAEATAIYGSRAAGGVIIIKTKGGNARVNEAGELTQQQQTMRTEFSDYAIWQPKLLTDADGNASFKVKFPDDITNWSTKLIAMNGRKQGGVAQTNIKSFKSLSANFVSPLFALTGDSINVIGKLMNYNNVNETVDRSFSYNGKNLLKGDVTFKNAKIDTVAIIAKGAGLKVRPEHVNVADSLVFEYTMKQANGYFDGEIRKIPLFNAGVTETKGYFNSLMRDTTVGYKFDPALGKVTLRAEASLFPTLLDEIEKLRNYEYLCNEQLASKLKALLLEKSVRKYLGENFKEEKNIKEILKKLQNNRLPEGTWGWWQNSGEELWISLHVVETLLQAQQQGYTVNVDKDKLYRYLLDKMINKPSFNQIYGLKLMRLLNEKYYINDWITAIEKQRAELEEKNIRDRKANSDVPLLPKQPLYEKLQLMQLKQQAGMPIDLKWLVAQKNETMFGNSYWGEEATRFWDNSIQNTLLAYQILKINGGYKDELDRIQRYFLEQRRDGQWRNTYESSLILQNILPELMSAPGKKPAPSSLVLNKTEVVTNFPFNKVIAPEALTVQKKGDSPVYFTAYQQFNNPKPEKVSKDFTVKTSFRQDGGEISKLKAGTVATLNVEVDVRADADYVMIEVPIPAGCSYENKMQSFRGVETHREYAKNKTSIFCTKLKKGKYVFSVTLMPRYSGNYILNPAKAEMMYFPLFYGREGIKRVLIN